MSDRFCVNDGCQRRGIRRGLCGAHYAAALKGRIPMPPLIRPRTPQAAYGLRRHTVHRWVAMGYLRPGPLNDTRTHQWTEDELEVAGRLAALHDAGFTPAAAAELARSGPGPYTCGGVTVTVKVEPRTRTWAHHDDRQASA
jgi:hypothetical protein